jgi:hypothetical protein
MSVRAPLFRSISARRLTLQPGDYFSRPLFPRGGNNAVRNPVNPFPRAYPESGVARPETFLRQFFSAALALPKTEHPGPQAVANAGCGHKLRTRVGPVSPRAGWSAMMTLLVGVRLVLAATSRRFSPC